MIHATKILADFVYGLKYEDLPEQTVETTKMYIVDYLAASFAGKKVNRKFNEAVENFLFEMGGKEEVIPFGKKKQLPLCNAAYLNAIYAHGADMDDGNRKAMGHVAAHVMSTAFAMAEKNPVTGKKLLAAINAGYEVYNRVAAAVQPGLVHRGFHSTGTAGAIACGAVAAKMLGLDSNGIYNAMALSAIQASGLIIIAESGQQCKPVNPANAARTGITSAILVSKGIDSSIYPLESQKGWFHAMSDDVDENAITEGLGTVFTIDESYLKPYPSCRHTHCGIEGAIEIREAILNDFGTVNAEDIDRINVYIYKNAIQIAGQISIPKVDDDSKFSIHYSLAIALLKGRFSLDDLPIENVTDEVVNIIKKINLIEDPSMENTRKGIRGARVEVIMRNKTRYLKEVPIPKGDAANPFSWEDTKRKLEQCSSGMLNNEAKEVLMEKVLKIETFPEAPTINELIGVK